ncbi:MAG: MerR family transcriptional regulator [Betaproteobacteria bacterium]|nr:MerR family transcriptional regulator [Betaproteobacteria bacterium]
MNLPPQAVEALLDDLWLDLDAMCRLAGVSEPWLRERLDEGLLLARHPAPRDRPREALRFGAADLRRAQRLACLERDFDAVPELAALVVDLEDELGALRARLRRLGLA